MKGVPSLILAAVTMAHAADQVMGLSPMEPGTRDSLVEETVRRWAAVKDLPVPLPEKTPYDFDPKAKEVFLKEYASGYREVLAGVMSGCHMGFLGPYFFAYQDGWAAGLDQGIKDHPAKYCETLGIDSKLLLSAGVDLKTYFKPSFKLVPDSISKLPAAKTLTPKEAEDWRNPVVRAGSVKGVTINGSSTLVDLACLIDELAALPESAWPYGRIVLLDAAQDLKDVEEDKTFLERLRLLLKSRTIEIYSSSAGSERQRSK